ncbi:MAG: alpha/beta hydrolase fold protein [Solirubrobacterales bacterium]|nr:alpha/beta hydrolase fold protein [Solirubrobacterales bacterium]
MGEHRIAGTRGTIVVHTWTAEDPRYVVLLAHGYGEHARRYDHVAAALVADGAAVYAPDHHGHGLSEGERALVDDLDLGVDDLHLVAERAAAEHRGLPTVLLGHSMGGLIAARYAQRFGAELAALVLSGPAVGGNPALLALAEMDPIPDVPIDPAVLSRDPAVGQAYADDPLVYHGPFRRETLLGLGAAVAAVAEGGTFGALPTLWIHGEEDQLVPLEHTRPAIEAVRGERFEEKLYPGARHEVFNETNRDEVIAGVVAFVQRSVKVQPE